MTGSTAHPIAGRRLLEALASPVRQEIVDALQALGPATVAEIAAELNRAPDSLYYHLRLLRKVDLVREAGTRDDGPRPEKVYDLPGRPLRMRYESSRPVRRAIGRTVAGVLRLAERDFDAALDRVTIVDGRPDRPLTGGRLKAWLTPAQRDRLLALLGEIDELMAGGGKAPDSELYALTRVLVPLDPHRRLRSDRADDDRKDP